MATLTSLPTELLHTIARASTGEVQECRRVYLNGPAVLREVRILGQQDLMNLTYVNRRLNLVINLVLYQYNRDYGDFYAIKHAVVRENIETLELIRAMQFNIHYHGLSKTSCHTLHVACDYGSLRMAEWLLRNGAAYEQLETREAFPQPMAPEELSCLRYAMHNRNEKMAVLLLSHGATPYFILEDHYIAGGKLSTGQFETALHHAARAKLPEVAKYLVQEAGLPVDVMNSHEETPLYEYFRHEFNLPYIEYDKHRGPDIRCTKEDVTMLQLFIRLGADVNFERRNEPLLLTHALRMSYYDHANVLLDAGAKVKHDVRRGQGIPEPIQACIRHEPARFRDDYEASKKRDILKKLIEGGVDLNERLMEGYTPLEEAVLLGLPETVVDLVELGASIGPTTFDGGNILDFFLRHYDELPYDRFKKAEKLTECGARIDMPLITTGESFLMELIERYVKEKNVVVPPIEPLLIQAARGGMKPEYLHHVLEKQVSHVPIRYTERVQICNSLIEHGAKLKDANIASTAASEFIDSTSQSSWCTKPSITEEEALFDSFLEMTPKKYLDGLLTRAQCLGDKVNTTKILKSMGRDMVPG
ncbi:ankyrin repeat-containing domain protein [Annulohypoxylon truncatum]|uniref:ankyrin repeat-containing domain protein n=1 Tax=Annulohypoxylon truncatum TaxID=327061 RepID=UPI00200889A0|nr:ankyrin repeat-containing domain protein [Annulohypoxylon truncatum]KAI1215185.1 ankyrin repeat-containing domain protein [Annulohypoxylon truncatum]